MSYLLSVDDDDDLQFLVRKLLESAGHQVESAGDGLAALACIERREPELIVLDVNMPGISGTDLCRTVKSNPFTARIPVLMLTAQGDIDHKIESYDAGADDYLSKPFEPRELLARVAALLRLVRRERDRNPTTGLPGVSAIQDEIGRRVARDERFAICYVDLDNFKPFADAFGFTVADLVISDTGAALCGAVGAAGCRDDFVGHIGGDDFIVVTREHCVEPIARECSTRFRDVIARALGEEALQVGYFSGTDRSGRRRRFPLAGLSVVGVTVEPARWVSAAHIGSFAAELKKRAKRLRSDSVLIEAL